ncbi:hypothetical protein [Flagellimonas myxillae]|uniref:hypothetical protein n=1 Tax=Flagellimonas myxillae TaxID=2942214 RepID=UPI00201F1680|nr:hypothetical protein [Muricauda myxillae]MCL6265811.1 hypothetical protein [Muricauda myxillae]
MEIKRIAIPLLCTVLFALTRCGNHNYSNKIPIPQKFKKGQEVITYLDHCFSMLDNLEKNTADYIKTVTDINVRIRKTIEGINSLELLKEVNKSYSLAKHEYLFTLSEDGKVAAFTWHSRMEESTLRIRNIALYASEDNKVVPTSLYGNPLNLYQIHTVEIDNKPLYLFHGSTESNQKQSFRIDAYTINNNGLEQLAVFPNRNSSLTSALDFDVEMDASFILKAEKWGSHTAYRPLELSTNHEKSDFVEALTKLDNMIGPQQFKITNSWNFLNGSELPTNHQNFSKNTFVFDDQLIVNLTYDATKDSSLAMLSTPQNDKIQLPFRGEASLVGKMGNYLFFSNAKDGKQDNLHLYDIDKREIRWTYPMPQAFLTEDSVVFTESIEPYYLPHNRKIECDSGLGINKTYYKVYAVKYREPTPIVEYTNQIFCGSTKYSRLAKL